MPPRCNVKRWNSSRRTKKEGAQSNWRERVSLRVLFYRVGENLFVQKWADILIKQAALLQRK